MLSTLDTNSFLIIFIISSSLIILILLLIIYYSYYLNNRTSNSLLIGSEYVTSHDLPYEFLNDEESMNQLRQEFNFDDLSPEEQRSYFESETFYHSTPPIFKTRGKSLSYNDELIIKERGIEAFEFTQDQTNYLAPKYIVEDKTEINFHNNDLPYSTITTCLNYCLPVKNRIFSDTIYFETKIFEFSNHKNPNGHFSIGLTTKPYPSFRLPGYNNFSIAYESTGNLKINKPLPTPLQQHQEHLNSEAGHSGGGENLFNALVLPPLLQSDVVGFGYHIPSGTVFITKNGRKLMDIMKGLYIDLYPAIGCFLTNGKFHVNLGQMGYVWIEANVKKYGFISTNDFKKLNGDRGLTSLPTYNLNVFSNDKLLDKGDELPPDYPEEEIDFFGRSIKDIYNLGSSSSKHKDHNKGKNEKDTATIITDDLEEIMDLRERIYEQSTITKNGGDGDNDEILPLLSNLNSHYQSIESESDSE